MSTFNYCANNPVLYIDPHGDTLNVSAQQQTAIDEFNKTNTDGTGGYYQTSLDENGNVVITATGKEGKMTKGQKNYFETLTTVVNSLVKTSINLVEDDINIEVADYQSKTIDMGDVKKIGDGKTLSKSSILGHEIWEQFNLAYGLNIYKAHESGSNKEGEVGNYYRDPYRTGEIVSNGPGQSVLTMHLNDGSNHSLVKGSIMIFFKDKNVVNVIRSER